MKTVKADTDAERIKLLQEAAIMGQFAHSKVVRLHGMVTMGEPVSGRERSGLAVLLGFPE